MLTAIGDYVVIPRGSKKAIARVFEEHPDGTFSVILENFRAYSSSPDTDTVSVDDILANLGRTVPAEGTVYGVKVKVSQDRISVKPWGNVVIFRDVTVSEKELLARVLNAQTALFNRLGLLSMASYAHLEIQPKRSLSGSYETVIGAEFGSTLDTLCLSPKVFEEGFLTYAFRHEFGHHLWYRLMPGGLRSSWIRIFAEALEQERIGENRIAALVEEFVNSGDLVAEFTKSLDDEAGEGPSERAIFKQIIKAICRAHRIRPLHIDAIIEAGEIEKIPTLWQAVKTVDVGQISPLISDYGRKSPEELWAEAFAYLLDPELRAKCPPALMTAAERTVTFMSGSVDAFTVLGMPAPGNFSETLEDLGSEDDVAENAPPVLKRIDMGEEGDEPDPAPDPADDFNLD